MELHDFINNFAQQFEMTEPEEITATTVYRDLEEWDSLLSLSIIGMINNTYQVKVSGEEVKDFISLTGTANAKEAQSRAADIIKNWLS